MEPDRAKLYNDANEFFRFGGCGVMKLTPQAASQVCLEAADRGYVIARIEGGLWLNPGFEARLDCIWEGAEPPLKKEIAAANNESAAKFILSEAQCHSSFVLTAPPLTGWPHKADKSGAPSKKRM